MRSRWVALLFTSATGCTLLYGPATSDFASGGTGDDAGAVEEGGGIRDAVAEKGTDAGAPFCPANALLCEDFERGALLGGPFANLTGSVSLSSTRAHSPTRSLSAFATKGKPTPALETLLAMPPKATLSFWFYASVPPPDTSYVFRIAHLLWGAGCDWELSWTMYLNTNEGLSMASDVYDEKVNPACGPIQTKPRSLLGAAQTFIAAWHHVSVTMDVSNQVRRITATIDERTFPVDDLPSNRPSVPTSATLAVGLPCIQNGGGCSEWNGRDYEVFIDDVTLVPAP